MKEEINYNGTTRCGHIDSPSDIKVWLNWPSLPHNEKESLVQKHLNYNLFKKFENMKDKEGVPFKNLIYYGIKYPYT